MADLEPRTYNLRDGQGYLAFTTDDLAEFVAECDRRLKARRKADRTFYIDDHDLAALKARLGEREAEARRRAEAAGESGSEAHVG